MVKQKDIRKKFSMDPNNSSLFISLYSGEKVKSPDIHHIFPVSEVPSLAAILENLIPLTTDEHRTIAHPKGNFSKIDSITQKAFLLKQADFIQIHEENGYHDFSKVYFVRTLNDGLKSTYKKESAFLDSMDWPQIKNEIEFVYDSII